jgi:hypothetical protein
MKIAGAQISLFFTSYEPMAPMAIEKIKNLGAVLEHVKYNLGVLIISNGCL